MIHTIQMESGHVVTVVDELPAEAFPPGAYVELVAVDESGVPCLVRGVIDRVINSE